MDIGTYARGVLRKSWVVVLLAVLAGAGAFALQRGAKDAHQATVDVTVPAAQSATAGSNGQYVANFAVALTTPAVVSQVAKETGEPAADLDGGLGADQLGSSSFIDVTYTAGDASTAVKVVDSAARATSALLAQPAIQTATTALDASKKALDVATAQDKTAQDALAAYTAKHGLVDPRVLYQAAQSSVTQLTVGKQQAIAQGRGTASFDGAIAAGQAQLRTLAPLVVEYTALTRSLNQADLAVQAAQSRVITATGDLADANAAPLVGAPTSTLVSARSTTVRAVAVAAGLGAVLGLGLVLLVQLVAATRRPRAPDGTAPATTRAVDVRDEPVGTRTTW